jgi:NADPH:quinone reductase-like Zn-dependent oxidoreductase
VSTAGSAVKESAAAADGGMRHVDIINLENESLADGLGRSAPGAVDVVIDALGGLLTGQAVGGLARRIRTVVLGYSAGTDPSLNASLARVAGSHEGSGRNDLKVAVLAAMLIEDVMAGLAGEGLAAFDGDVMGCWALG